MKPLSHYVRKLADRLQKMEIHMARFLEQKQPQAAEAVSEDGQ